MIFFAVKVSKDLLMLISVKFPGAYTWHLFSDFYFLSSAFMTISFDFHNCELYIVPSQALKSYCPGSSDG